MSYLVLARKWRPQRFEDVMGQEHVVRTLSNAIKNERLAHAYLFTGVRGVGKTSVARILAKALNCEKGPTPTPCNVCEQCKEITGGSSVDVLEIDGASNTGVDDVRELRENVRYLPQSSKYKVYIIDEVHMLSNAAFNALLKTLEEPPPHVVFIFATTEPHKIPTTILSRCQRFDFTRVSRVELLEGLNRICEQEGIKIDVSDMATLVRKSEGSVRDSLSLLDQVVSFSGKEIPKGEVARALGVADHTWIAELAEATLDGDISRALAVTDRAFDGGFNLKELLGELMTYIRDVAVVRETDKPDEIIDLPKEEIETIKKISGRISPQKIQAVFGILLKAEERISRVQDPRSVLEMALIKATHADPAMPIGDVIERIEAMEKRLSGSAQGSQSPPSSGTSSPRPSTPASSPKAAPSTPPKESASTGLTWRSLLEAVREKEGSLIAAYLEAANLDGVENDVVNISVPRDSFQYEQLHNKQTHSKIEAIASELRGSKVKLRIHAKDASAKPESARETDLEKARKKEARENPTVMDALDLLGATIVDIRVKNAGQSREDNG